MKKWKDVTRGGAKVGDLQDVVIGGKPYVIGFLEDDNVPAPVVWDADGYYYHKGPPHACELDLLPAPTTRTMAVPELATTFEDAIAFVPGQKYLEIEYAPDNVTPVAATVKTA